MGACYAHLDRVWIKSHMNLLCPDSIYILILGSHKAKKESSYLVDISKKNTGIDTTNWRVYQFRKAKAKPPNIICPKPAAQTISVVPMAWNLGIVHSVTERQHKLCLGFM
jgi:hypothetical protein